MIDRVYKTLLTVINKENQGYVDPSEFNLVANTVQSEIFRGYFEEENLDKNKQNRGLTNRGYSNLDFIQRQKIDYMAEISTIPPLLETALYSTYQLPTNLYYIEDDGVITSDGIIVEEVERGYINSVMSSEAKPTVFFPIYERYRDIIRAYPDLGKTIDLRYVREPLPPNWTYMVVTSPDGKSSELYDPSNSSFQDFDLHPTEFSNIVVRMASYFGVAIREIDVTKIMEGLRDKIELKDKE